MNFYVNLGKIFILLCTNFKFITMKSEISSIFRKIAVFCFIIFSIFFSFSQNDTIPKTKSEFWKKVQFGGGLGLGLGNDYTNISISPTGYYNINPKVAVGVGLTGSYVSQKSDNNYLGYKSTILGGSLIGLFNPINEIQLSAELEQLRVNRKFDSSVYLDDDFWNTAVFLGAGYRTQNVTLGVKYNILHNDKNQVYSQAWLPFVRVMF
jgi:hypothetical protein